MSCRTSSSPSLNERINNLLIFQNVGSIIQSKLLSFGSVFISDLYLFQDIVLLNEVLWKFDAMIYGQSNYRDIKITIIYLN